jgi:hypothetical protein
MSVVVPVELGDRSYQIHIGDGLMGQAGALLSGVLARSASRRVRSILPRFADRAARFE